MKNAAAGKYKLSEAEWQRQVLQMGRALGWLVAYFRPAFDRGKYRTAVGGDGAGFPDLVLCHEKTGDTIFAELKRDGVKVSDAAQKLWGAALALQCDYRVWTPSQFEEVRLRLSRPRRDFAFVPTGSLAEMVKTS